MAVVDVGRVRLDELYPCDLTDERTEKDVGWPASFATGTSEDVAVLFVESVKTLVSISRPEDLRISRFLRGRADKESELLVTWSRPLEHFTRWAGESTRDTAADYPSVELRNQGAIRLLRRWLADESGYDERVWPSLKRSIEQNRLSFRSRFSG